MFYESFLRFEEWREEQEEMWMWGCKRSRTARSSIRMCWYHIFSEASPERFVLRTRASPSCVTECVKIQCHDRVRNQKQWCWRWLLVFLVGEHQSSYVSSSMCVKTSFLDDNQEQQAKCEFFSVLISEGRKGPGQPGSIVFLVHCSDAHTRSASQYSSWRWVALQLQLHLNPDLLDSVVATPLLRPVTTPIAEGQEIWYRFHGLKQNDPFCYGKPWRNKWISYISNTKN